MDGKFWYLLEVKYEVEFKKHLIQLKISLRHRILLNCFI